MKKILPMGISRLSRKFLIVPPNSNALALLITMNFTAASSLVGSGSYVTKRNSTKRGLGKNALRLGGRVHVSSSYALLFQCV
jgi:hypothetical protein